MSEKYALIIGNTEYIDPGLAQLTAPGKDAEDFARVLKDPNICGFDDVRVLLNQLSSTVIEAMDEFFDQKKPDDLLVLFFSGHGVRDELGSLYLAVKNTIRSRLRSTAIKSDYIREVMDQSRSRRQVLILDCCNSGAFAHGAKGEIGGAMGMLSAFQGYGRYVLTASDATQFAWEGNQVIGETENSLFTHFLVKGLEGEADSDGDGKITVDELYDYAFEQIVRLTPKQKPNKSATKQEGEIVLRQITRLIDIKPVSLPQELIEATEDVRTFVREGAIQQLDKLLRGKNLGLARSARETLERIEREDDSRRVSQAATQALEPIRQSELSALQKAEEERLAVEKMEAERRLLEKAEDERKVKEEVGPPLADQEIEEVENITGETEKAALGQVDDRETTYTVVKPELPKSNSEQERSNVRRERKLIVYIVTDGGIPLYESLPASNNWSVLLDKGTKLFVTKPDDATESIGKYGHFVEVTDSRGNHGFVVANSISIKRPASIKIKQESTAQTITEEVNLKTEVNNIREETILGWIILGTAISGAVGGVWSWPISGAICGLAISIPLRNAQILSTWQNQFWIVLAWLLGGVIGWQIDFRMPIGGFFTGGLISWTIGGLITAIILRMEHVLNREQSMIYITLGWAIAGAIGWLLGGSMSGIIGWAIGWGIGGAIGGSVMYWNINKRT
jgi:hypothetical protein